MVGIIDFSVFPFLQKKKKKSCPILRISPVVPDRAGLLLYVCTYTNPRLHLGTDSAEQKSSQLFNSAEIDFSQFHTYIHKLQNATCYDPYILLAPRPH